MTYADDGVEVMALRVPPRAAVAVAAAAAASLAPVVWATLKAYPQLSCLNDINTTKSNETFSTLASVLNPNVGWPAIARPDEGEGCRGMQDGLSETLAAAATAVAVPPRSTMTDGETEI